LLGISIAIYNNTNLCGNIIWNVQIPDRNQVNEFCKNEGYKYGWLDVECGINKVKCYKSEGKYNLYECVYMNIRK
jgi:hypothetical protein